ncbi:MAG: hypothetical protein IKB06_04515 [Clostridia bacterium]|nr:hypothetical protein [Clostridia bacterium]
MKLETQEKTRFDELKELMEKQLEIEKLNKKTPFWKKVLIIFTAIASLGFLTFVCYMMYKQSFTMETLLTVLLSFFSIALSIMFYIQSEKSSSEYYSKSYDIMKDVSIAIGKIEAGFGEKFVGITDKLSSIEAKAENHKENLKEKVKEKVEEQKEIQNNLIKTKDKEIEKREELVKKLTESSDEIARLKMEIARLERRKRLLSRENEDLEMMQHYSIRFPKKEVPVKSNIKDKFYLYEQINDEE